MEIHIPVFYQKQQNRLRKVFTFYSLAHVTQISWCTKKKWKCEIKIYFNFLLCKILRGPLATIRAKWAALQNNEIICCICCCYIYFLLHLTHLRVVWYSSLSNIDVQSLWWLLLIHKLFEILIQSAIFFHPFVYSNHFFESLSILLPPVNKKHTQKALSTFSSVCCFLWIGFSTFSTLLVEHCHPKINSFNHFVVFFCVLLHHG